MLEQDRAMAHEKENLKAFDKTVDEKKFKRFLEEQVHCILNIIRDCKPSKRAKHMYDPVLDDEHMQKYLKYCICENIEQMVIEFCRKNKVLRPFFDRRVANDLIFARQEAAFLHCILKFMNNESINLLDDI